MTGRSGFMLFHCNRRPIWIQTLPWPLCGSASIFYRDSEQWECTPGLFPPLASIHSGILRTQVKMWWLCFAPEHLLPPAGQRKLVPLGEVFEPHLIPPSAGSRLSVGPGHHLHPYMLSTKGSIPKQFIKKKDKCYLLTSSNISSSIMDCSSLLRFSKSVWNVVK